MPCYCDHTNDRRGNPKAWTGRDKHIDSALWNVWRRGGVSHRKWHGVGFRERGLRGCCSAKTSGSGPSVPAVMPADSWGHSCGPTSPAVMSLRWFCGNFHSTEKVAKPFKAGIIKEMWICCFTSKQSYVVVFYLLLLMAITSKRSNYFGYLFFFDIVKFEHEFEQDKTAHFLFLNKLKTLNTEIIKKKLIQFCVSKFLLNRNKYPALWLCNRPLHRGHFGLKRLTWCL